VDIGVVEFVTTLRNAVGAQNGIAWTACVELVDNGTVGFAPHRNVTGVMNGIVQTAGAVHVMRQHVVSVTHRNAGVASGGVEFVTYRRSATGVVNGIVLTACVAHVDIGVVEFATNHRSATGVMNETARTVDVDLVKRLRVAIASHRNLIVSGGGVGFVTCLNVNGVVNGIARTACVELVDIGVVDVETNLRNVDGVKNGIARIADVELVKRLGVVFVTHRQMDADNGVVGFVTHHRNVDGVVEELVQTACADHVDG
jgi:hypothetical protein